MNTIELIACTACGTVLHPRSYQQKSITKEDAQQVIRDHGMDNWDVCWTRVNHCPSCKALRIFNEYTLIGERS